jgi:DNA-binding Lrp family transcriptional regulator
MDEIINLDKKDRKILYHLDLNPRQSNSEIGKAVGLSKDVVNYRIKQLENNGVIRWYGTVGNIYKLGIIKIKVYFTLQNETLEKRKEIINYLCNYPTTEWVAEMSGRWDLTAGYLVRDIYEFNEALLDFLEKYSQYVNEKELTITLGVYHFKKDWLLFKERKKFPNVYQSGKKEGTKIDELDDFLLKILTNNAKLPLIKIAEITKQKPQTIKYRLTQLKKKGLITTSKVFMDFKKIGKLFYKSHVYLQNTTERRIKSLISFCESCSDITYVIKNIGLGN